MADSLRKVLLVIDIWFAPQGDQLFKSIVLVLKRRRAPLGLLPFLNPEIRKTFHLFGTAKHPSDEDTDRKYS
jgi:hypothetical protein